MEEGLSKNFMEKIEKYLDSHNMSEKDLFEILNKHDEDLEKERIHELENEICMAISEMSGRDLKKMIKKAAENSNELSITKPFEAYPFERHSFERYSFKTHPFETSDNNLVEVTFRDNSWNNVKLSFVLSEYFDKGGITSYVVSSFDYWLDIDSHMKLFFMEQNIPPIKKMSNETKIKLLTNLYKLIKDTENSWFSIL